MPEQHDNSDLFMTVREMVSEIRSDVKDLKEQAAHMSQAREQITDHEQRMRSLERWKYGIPISGVLAVIGAITALSSHAL